MFNLLKKNKKILTNNHLTLSKLFKFNWSGGWYFSAQKNSALKINMFFSCVRLIANTIATTPINLINKNNQPINIDLQFLLKHRPNNEQTAFDFWYKITTEILIFGKSFVKIYKNKNDIFAFEIIDNELAQNLDKLNDIIVFKFFNGERPIDLLLQTLSAADKLNKYIENSNLPPVLKTPERLMQDEQVEKLSSDLHKKLTEKSISEPIVLPKDFELILSNSKGVFAEKFSELKNFTNEEIARFFNVPFGLVGLGGASQPNVLDTQNKQFLQYCLNPLLRMIEQTIENAIFNRKQLLNGDRVKFNRNAILMQTDANSRADFYSKMLEIGAYDLHKIKALEDL